LCGFVLSLPQLSFFEEERILYQGFYNLKENPFRLSPDPAFMCMTAQHREALAGLIYSVWTHPGLSVLVGEAGTGKTTLLYSLLELLEKRRFVTAMCTNPTLTREEFYDLLMMKFGVDCGSSLKSRQLMALQEKLLRNRAEGRPSLLIVDEAQRLPTELLEEIRLLLNIETPREKLLEIIVAGQPELSDILARPELRQLKQRVSCICKLKALSPQELREYLHHRLTLAGLPRQTLFPEETIQLIYSFTQGIPRLVNSLCNGALLTGFAMRSPNITASIIGEAARDLELRQEVADETVPMNGVAAIAVGAERPLAPSPPPGPVAVPAPKAGRGANGSSEVSMPVENYAARQKTLGFFSSLLDRWK
jgi:general secretion pathway protein A